MAIIGRPNVGKSTLFNRLTETRKAIVAEISGVTRDRQFGNAEWNGHEFSLIDTGGYAHGDEDVFQPEIRNHVKMAIEEADQILFVVDVTTGVTAEDQEVAKIIRKSGKPCFLVVNKADNIQRLDETYPFHSLGLGDLYPLSSINGSGTGELLDALVASFTKSGKDEMEGLPKFAIVGQPNVGKSSLLNMLTGTERSIVTPVAGTTRDAIHTIYKGFGNEFVLIDTAGLRRKARVSEDVEFYSVLRSVRAIEEADVCLLMIDATQGLHAQDLAIFRLAEKNKKGIVMLVNKWDLVDKDQHSARDYELMIKKKIAPLSDIPILFVSVHDKQRIHKALETAIRVYENRKRKIPGAKLNKVMLPIIEGTPPPALRGRFVKIKYVSQIPSTTPSFVFFCNHPKQVREDYERFLENQLRQNFDFTGVPVTIIMRGKE